MMRQVNKDATPSRYATCEWFYHAPLKQPEEGANGETSIPPASQIPGLSDLAEPHNELANQSRRKWIKDTDSDYVKLSKQGGRPDLLKQVTAATRKGSPVAYSIPDWYTHEAMTLPAKQTDAAVSYLPDYMVHEESKTEESDDKYESHRGPFDFDKKTVWQRDADDNEKENQGEKKQIKLPAIKPSVKPEKATAVPNNVFPATTTTKQEHPGKKVVFPPMHSSRNNDPVNFSKLLSNGYGDDWIQKRNDKDKKAQKSSNTEKLKDPALSSEMCQSE